MIYVAAYCRVSTEREDQANSFESQQRYFHEYISRTDGWQLYKIYAEEGLSGTSTKKRKAFNRMIEDAKDGKFSMIVTKEISRFARNTLDSIYYTRELKRHGVGVFFLNDNINTLDPDAELRLTILSSIAQEESRRTSERVKWGQKRRMEQGVVFGSSMLGYDVKNGQIYRNEEGAKVVSRIYHKFLLEGKGTYVIANELREEGILPMKAKRWSSSVILRILRNEKYCGDLIQKKTYTPDYLTHEKRYNYGEEEYVIVTNHHVPIVTREMFNQVQVILDSRASKMACKERESTRYAFSGKIVCGSCGKCFIARSRVRKDESLYLVWRCYHNGKNVDSNKVDVNRRDGYNIDENVVVRNKLDGKDLDGKDLDRNNVEIKIVKDEINAVCISSCIKNEDLVEIFQKIAILLPIDKEEFINQMMELMKRCLARAEGQNEIQNKIVEIEEERKRLLLAYRKNYISEAEFVEAREECDKEEELYRAIMGKEIQESSKYRECNNQKYNTLAYNDFIDREESIKGILKDIIYGVRFNDTVCQEIVDRIVRTALDTYDVYYKGLPDAWRVYLVKTK